VLAAFDAGVVDGAALATAATSTPWLPAELAAAARLLADRYADPAWHADPDPG
jgi:hypothetical protein